MARLCERLRHEREARNTSIEDIAVASGIGQGYLEALERGEIDALPGPAFGKLYIRAYAEVLGFDPQPWIDDYDRERRRMQSADGEQPPRPHEGSRPVAAAIARWKESLSADKPGAAVDSAVEPAVEPVAEAITPVPEPAPDEPDVRSEESPAIDPVVPEIRRRVPRVPRPVAAIVALAVVAAASWIYLARLPRVATVPASRPTEPRPVEPRPPDAPPIVHDAPETPRGARPRAPEPVSAPGTLTVPESATGRRIVASRLEGEATEFTEGEVVVFQTRVLGGARGETVRHVWIYDGRAQQSISLRLGGADWRTHSKKTLYRRGPWTVEARDRNGRVLASSAFICVPAAP